MSSCKKRTLSVRPAMTGRDIELGTAFGGFSQREIDQFVAMMGIAGFGEDVMDDAITARNTRA